jgi:hypothetical protein
LATDAPRRRLCDAAEVTEDMPDLLEALPFPYAAALRLAHAGASDQMIATALAIEPEGVPAVTQLAHAQLDAIAAGRSAKPT